MTDEQVIKALECLTSEKDVLCAGCEYRHFEGNTCHKANAKDALTVIQRQKAEIDRLTERIEREAKCQYDLCGQIVDLKEQLATARANAVREFAERAKAHTRYSSSAFYFSKIIDELVAREMTEGER